MASHLKSGIERDIEVSVPFKPKQKFKSSIIDENIPPSKVNVKHNTSSIVIERLGYKIEVAEEMLNALTNSFDLDIPDDIREVEGKAELFAIQIFTHDSSITLEKIKAYKNTSPMPIFDESIGQGAMFFHHTHFNHFWTDLYNYIFDCAINGQWNHYLDILDYRLDGSIVTANKDALYDLFFDNEDKIFEILEEQFKLEEILPDIGFKLIRISELGVIAQSF